MIDLGNLVFDVISIGLAYRGRDFGQLVLGVDRKRAVAHKPFIRDDQFNVGDLVFYLEQFLVLGLGRHKDDFSLAVIENIGSLRTGVGGVNGNGNSLSGLDAKIRDRPAKSVLRKDRYLVTWLHPCFAQSPGQL